MDLRYPLRGFGVQSGRIIQYIQMATTSSITDEPIRTTNELEFAFFCIESVAERLHQDPVKVYNALTKDSDLLNSYIVPLYDILHTQSKQYIVDDIIEVMKSRGIDI